MQTVETGIKQRKLYIDSLRGLAMMIVVYGHCLLSKGLTEYSSFFVFTSAFNVSLFFVISGYLFSKRNGDTKQFFKYVLLRLIVPWFVLGLFPYYSIQESFPLLLSGDNFWFMPALIIGEIIWFFINKYSRNNFQVILCGLFVSSCGLVLYKLGVFNYAMINRALTLQWLFVVGLIIKQHEGTLIPFVKKYVGLFVLVYLLCCVIFHSLYPGEFFDIHHNRYYFIPLTWGVIVSGVLIIYTLFKICPFHPKWLVLIGQNTLPIYMFSDYGRLCFRKLYELLQICPLPFYPVTAILETCFACALCLGFSQLANKYVPEIVGRKRC